MTSDGAAPRPVRRIVFPEPPGPGFAALHSSPLSGVWPVLFRVWVSALRGVRSVLSARYRLFRYCLSGIVRVGIIRSVLFVPILSARESVCLVSSVPGASSWRCSFRRYPSGIVRPLRGSAVPKRRGRTPKRMRPRCRVLPEGYASSCVSSPSSGSSNFVNPASTRMLYQAKHFFMSETCTRSRS